MSLTRSVAKESLKEKVKVNIMKAAFPSPEMPVTYCHENVIRKDVELRKHSW